MARRETGAGSAKRLARSEKRHDWIDRELAKLLRDTAPEKTGIPDREVSLQELFAESERWEAEHRWNAKSAHRRKQRMDERVKALVAESKRLARSGRSRGSGKRRRG